MATKIGAVAYIENSALTMDGVKNVRNVRLLYKFILMIMRDYQEPIHIRNENCQYITSYLGI